ncbi:RHOMBOID-like protein 1 [Vitis vinifera]|uniref:RHOMBOID-like protein n=1 Tax=Vitis vinifera TaxID=29760 RepID=A0A438DEH7_VITVI|nr:RHOMBOID-like protein 1 [Vitis vinifera]
MARDPSSSIEIRVLSKRGSNVIHPVEVDTPPLLPSPSPGPVPVVYREIKHFKKWVPWLIPSFVVANIIMFGITMYVNNCPKNSISCIADFLGRFSFQPFKENPLLGPSSSTLQKMGALDVSRVVDRHQDGALSLAFVKVGLLYVISGFGGSLLSGLFIQENISVGASGALFGLLGACFLSSLLIGQYMLISWQHLDPRDHHCNQLSSGNPSTCGQLCSYWRISVRLTLGLVMLLRGVDANDRCSWCHYLSCVPTSNGAARQSLHTV